MLSTYKDPFTFEQALAVHHVSKSFMVYDLWSLKDNARRYLAIGNLNRAINQTRLALLTYRELKKGTSC